MSLNKNKPTRSSFENTNRDKSIINILSNKNETQIIPIKNEILKSKIQSQRSLKRRSIDENKISTNLIKSGTRNSNPWFDVNYFKQQILKHKSIEQLSNVDKKIRSYFTCNISSIKRKNKDYVKYLESRKHKRNSTAFFSNRKYGEENLDANRPHAEFKSVKHSNLMVGLDLRYQTTSYVSMDRK